MRIVSITLLVMFAGAFFPAHAAKLPRYGVFIYSSECWEKESGDAAGTRVLLVRDGSSDTLYWYWSDGPMEGPAAAHPLSIDDKTAAIKFSVDMGSEIGESSDGHKSVEAPFIQAFQGTISDDRIILSHVADDPTDTTPPRKMTIPRVRDFRAKPGECK